VDPARNLHPGRESATVAFVDLAGFSAITDVYGDQAAIRLLEVFEGLVSEALAGHGPPVKWIGDEAMLAFPDPETALHVLGRLLPACRAEPRLPLTRSGVHHGPIIRRGSDMFGSTVNIAARIVGLAAPGQLLATRPVAEAAATLDILAQDLGSVALRSVAEEVPLWSVELAPVAEPGWIDPVCKMHAPYASFRKAHPDGPWFCSELCAEAYRRSPQTYGASSGSGTPT
jgi:class 3 adenylate cyclase/YHS domain-containing protein